MSKRRTRRGQGLVEFALVLPILLLLLFGVVEIGHALRSYLIVVNADREGCRFAARGRFSDQRVIERVISAGGVIPTSNPPVPFLRTHGAEPNTAVIVRHLVIDSSGEVVSDTKVFSGVVPSGETMRPVDPYSDTVISTTQIVDRHRAAMDEIGAAREAAGYERMRDHVVVVEVHYAHHPLWGSLLSQLSFGIVPGDPWMIRFHTEMRVVTDRGGGTRRFFGLW